MDIEWNDEPGPAASPVSSKGSTAVVPPRGPPLAGTPADGRPPPALFREVLEQLHAAHQREVAYLEKTISRLAHQGHGAAAGAPERSARSARDVQASVSESDVSEPNVSDSGDPADVPPTQDENTADAQTPVANFKSQASLVGSRRSDSSFVGSMGSMETYTDGAHTDTPPSTLGARTARTGRSQSCLSDSVDQEVGELGRGQHVWQWQRSRGGFRSYPEAQNKRIEEAYRRGCSKVRIKGGDTGTTPMEIFFVDMIQLDPESRNIRKVRRVGANSWCTEVMRKIQNFTRSVYHGEPRWESYREYKKRQSRMTASMTATTTDKSETSNMSYQDKSTYRRMIKKWCRDMLASSWFLFVSGLVTFVNVIYIGVIAEFEESSRGLFARSTVFIMLEHLFLMYFAGEVLVQFIGARSLSAFLRDLSICIDVICTVAMLVEVIIVPLIGSNIGSTPMIQVLRLVRLVRILKLFRNINDVVITLRSIAVGMRSAAFIWLLIGTNLYACTVALTTAAHDQSEYLREKYFGSMGQTASTLISRGIALDGLTALCEDLRVHDGLFIGIMMSAFVCLTYFVLLNMLVGTFCRVAVEVADVERDSLEIMYLERHLQGILDMYLDEGCDTIKFNQFALIMQDVDALETLRTCGTDLEGLLLLSEVIFPHDDSEITIVELVAVIVRLRKGKSASVTEILGLQEFMKQKTDRLEQLLYDTLQVDGAGNATVRVGTHKSGSIFDAPRLKTRIMDPASSVTSSASIPDQHRRADLGLEETVRNIWTRGASNLSLGGMSKMSR